MKKNGGNPLPDNTGGFPLIGNPCRKTTGIKHQRLNAAATTENSAGRWPAVSSKTALCNENSGERYITPNMSELCRLFQQISIGENPNMDHNKLASGRSVTRTTSGGNLSLRQPRLLLLAQLQLQLSRFATCPVEGEILPLTAETLIPMSRHLAELDN